MSDDALSTWLSFNDLKHAGIVKNWQCLQDWINDPKIAFPRGKLFGPNTRRWNKEREIDPWLESRPVDRDEFKTKANDTILVQVAQEVSG